VKCQELERSVAFELLLMLPCKVFFYASALLILMTVNLSKLRAFSSGFNFKNYHPIQTRLLKIEYVQMGNEN